MDSQRLQKSRTFPSSVEQAYDTVLQAPLQDIFSRRYGAIAPIGSVEGQDGQWGILVP